MYIKCDKLLLLSTDELSHSSERLNDTRFSETTGGLSTSSNSSTHRRVRSDGGTEHEMYVFNVLLLIIIVFSEYLIYHQV